MALIEVPELIDMQALAPSLHLNEVISYRELLPFVLNENGLLGEGAEIGVQLAQFSAELLEKWHGRRLYSIDPWHHFTDGSYVDAANVEQARQDRFYQQVCERLAPYGERSHLLRLTSVAAAAHFREGQLDFAYLDAQHDYLSVREDLSHWYPKVKAGGIIGGHDYINGTWKVAGEFGVKRAVDEFAKEKGLQVLTTGLFDAEGNSCMPSWFILKS
jgi:hypothetical protein